MKNQRIKADNVDQLLEIVRAVQRGEDPGEALERAKAEKEKAEAIAMAEAMAAAAEAEEKLSESKKTARKKKSASESEPLENEGEEDEFEQTLKEERADTLPLQETARSMKNGLKKAAGLFLKGSDKPDKKKKRKHADAENENAEEHISVSDAEELSEEASASGAEVQSDEKISASEINVRSEETVSVLEEQTEEPVRTPEEISEDMEKFDHLFEHVEGNGRMLGRERLSTHASRTDSASDNDSADHGKKAFGIAASLAGIWKTWKEKEPDEELDKELDKELDNEFESEEETAEENTQEKLVNTEMQKISSDESADEEVQGEMSGESAKSGVPEEASDGSAEAGVPEEVSDGSAEAGVSEEASGESAGKTRKWNIPSIHGIRDLSKRKMVILTAAAVLIILLIVMVVNIVQHSIDEKKKSENVAADKGLIATVENDPQEWCSSYLLELRFRTKGKPVTKVVINGASLQPDVDGNVIYEASEYRLEATAVTEDMTYQAVIEIPKLDAGAPVVYAQRSDNQVILTASDDRSSIRKIWYAELKERDYIRLPVYQEYAGAIPYQKGSVYYFYAEDAAGNCSAPVITTMELAESLQFSEETIMMYPEESIYLDVKVNPEQALLNGLQFTSSDPSVAVVDTQGKVTALAEGRTTITVSAEGVAEARCSVEVARERTLTVSTIGDCTLGADQSFNTNVNFDAFATVNGHEYFFRNVADILKNDDVTFANLEGTLTTSTSREVKQYAFKGDPSYTEVLTSGSVDVVTLANNHSSDYGEQSLTDTQMYLTEAGIDYCMGDTYAVKNINGVKTAFIGIYVLRDGMECEDQVRATIAAAKADGADLVIVGFHWGSEKATTPDETQTSLAHIAVDCGADLVVGHHPHVLQGIEKYNGKYIVYSLGNFCFGGNTAPSDTDTMIFRQTFTIRDGKVQDDDQIAVIPCSITSADGYNNYQPTPADEADAQRIMERINQYSEPFGQSYTASTGL